MVYFGEIPWAAEKDVYFASLSALLAYKVSVEKSDAILMDLPLLFDFSLL
jgi:hypothetical protein